MHVDENLAQGAVRVFARAQVHLVPADHRLLRVTLSSFGQFCPSALAVDAFGALPGEFGDAFLPGFVQVGFLRQVADQRRRQGLAELRAVAVDRDRLDAEVPGGPVRLLAVLHGRRRQHVDGLGDRSGNEALGRSHHRDVAVDAEAADTALSAGVGAVEHRKMLGTDVRGILKRHRAAHELVGLLDLLVGKSQMPQEIEGRVLDFLPRHPKPFPAEIRTHRTGVDQEGDVKGSTGVGFDLADLLLPESKFGERSVIDVRGPLQRAVARRMGDHVVDLLLGISQNPQCVGHRAVDDLEIAAAGQLLELDQREIRLDAGGVAVHHQPDRSGRGNDGRLRVSEAVPFAKLHGPVPALPCRFGKFGNGAVLAAQRNREDGQFLVSGNFAANRPPVVAHDPKHVGGVPFVARKRAELPGHFRRNRVGFTAQDRCQRGAGRPALVGIVADPHVHQQTAEVCVAESQGPEPVRQLGNSLRRKLGHQHRDLQRHRQQPDRVQVLGDVEAAVIVEVQEVYGRKVAGRVVEEHVFRAGVGRPDLSVLGTGVPCIYRVVILNTRVGAGPRRVPYVLPEVLGTDRPRDLVVGPAAQFPVAILFHRLHEGIGHSHRIVGILARDGCIGFRFPIGVVDRKVDFGVSLPGILQHPVDVGLRNHRPSCGNHRFPEPGVPLRVACMFNPAVPASDRLEQILKCPLGCHGSRDEGRHLLLLPNLPVDELLDVGMVHVADDHLGGAARGAAGLDGAGRPVADLEKAHQPA